MVMKGYIHTIEVVIAASIILIGIGLIFRPYSFSNVADMKQQGYDALAFLDDSGKLRSLIATDNVAGIDKELKQLIDYNFKTEVCKESCNSQNIPTVSEKDVVVIDYYISGYRDNDTLKINPMKLRVYLWK